MGRFFEAATPTFVDNKMFQLPYELMAKNIEKKDAAIDADITSYQDRLKELKAQVLEQDSPELQKTIADYTTRIDQAVSQIQADPMNYQRYSSGINTLKQDIAKDWSSTGKIGTMSGYYTQVQKEYEEIDKLAKEKGYEPEYIARQKALILEKYKGAQWNAETGKAGAKPTIASAYHALAPDDGFLSHMKARGVDISRETTNGPWIQKHATKSNTLTQAQIHEAYLAYAATDTATQEALRNRKESGQTGYENLSVGLDEAYVNIPKIGANGKAVLDANGKPVTRRVLNGDNYYGKRMNAAGLIYEQSQKSVEDGLSQNGNFWKFREEAAAEAKESKEALFAESNVSTGFTSNATSLNTLGESWTRTSNSMSKAVGVAMKIANQYGIKGEAALAQIKAGNFSALRDIKNPDPVVQGTLDQITETYKLANAEKRMTDASIKAFRNTLTKSNVLFADKNWNNHPDLVTAYEKYKANHKVSDIKEVQQVVSLNGMGMGLPEKKSIENQITEQIDNVSFEFAGPQGKNMILTNKQGQLVTITTNESKKNTYITTKEGKKVKLIYSPTTAMSMTSLMNLGIVGKNMTVGSAGSAAQDAIPKTDTQEGVAAKAAVKSTPYVFYDSSGKEVGFTVDASAAGRVRGKDNRGKTNLAATVKIGSNHLPITISSDQITSPTLKKYDSDPSVIAQDNFVYLDNKYDWKDINMEIKTGNPSNPTTYEMRRGEAYRNGVIATGAADIEAIKKIVMGL